jgi:hypothetical protein
LANEPVALDELLRAREDLIDEIVGKMPEKHRRFLISVKHGEPDTTNLRLLDFVFYSPPRRADTSTVI